MPGHRRLAAALAASLTLSLPWAAAKEYPAGKPQQRHGLEIAAVYLQPVDMAPPGRPAADSDIHLEADIRASDDYRGGFGPGQWIPYLHVTYELSKQGGDWKQRGDFMPMVANDGPHYGANVKLAGPGRYHLRYTIYPPNAPQNPCHGRFARHTDRLTGVAPWFAPFTAEFDFVYAGIGKRGGY